MRELGIVLGIIIWFVMIGVYVVTAILMWKYIDPEGFWKFILWLITWQLIAGAVDNIIWRTFRMAIRSFQ